jgi:YggT family protein
MADQSLFGTYWPYYIPTWLLLAAIAYLLARAVLSLFVRPDSLNVVWRMLVVATEPIMRFLGPLIPRFMVEGLRPVAAAGWLWLVWMLFRELMASQGLAPPSRLG